MTENKIQTTKIFYPNQRLSVPFWKTWGIIFRNVIESRQLIWYLYKRDFAVRYRKSFLGSTWILISPLLAVVSWVFMNQTGFFRPGDLEVPYLVYVLVGTSVWRFFMKSYTDASKTLENGKKFSSQVYYPHEIMVAEQALISATNFSITFAINLVVVLLYGISLSWMLIFFPLVLLPLFFLGTGIGLISGLINVVVTDLKRVLDYVVGLFMWVTPVVYSTKLDNELIQLIVPYNPLTYLVSSAREIVISGELYEPKVFFICAAASLVFFLIALRLFWVSEHRLIERLV
ncbi:MAG: ABC transporter permease [Chloroflexota bacterium]